MPEESLQGNKKPYRKILHIDLDAFYCAVEELLDPSLRGKAFAVGGLPDERGVVSSCSYPARRYGIHSAMPMAQALRRLPRLIVVHGHYSDYSQASHRTMEILENITPLVEQISIDEAFLDVTDLPEDGRVIAEGIQRSIFQEVKLPSSLGVAQNKLMAKIANNIGKASHRGDGPPMAIKVVSPGSEADFLAPLPVKELWGIGPKTAARLESHGILTIGDLAALPEKWLVEAFGVSGASLYRHARGIDTRPVSLSHDTKSISNEVTFSKDIRDIVVLKDNLRRQAEKVGRQLRKAELIATTVRIKLRWSDFSTLTRQETLSEPFDQDSVIFNTAWTLFEKTWIPGKPVRLVGLGVSNLQQKAIQLNLWETDGERERRLLTALDDLRDRYGKDVIRRARGLPSSDTRPDRESD